MNLHCLRRLGPIAIMLFFFAGDDASAEFTFLPMSTTSACVNYRPSPSALWGYLRSNSVSSQSAMYFCKTYSPGSVSGSVGTGCYTSGSYRYSISVDCPYNSTSDDACSIQGSASLSYSPYSNYMTSIRCISAPSWPVASTFSVYATGSLQVGGVYGTQIDRTVSTFTTLAVTAISPDTSMAAGTICLPTPSPNATSDSVIGAALAEKNLAMALCRTVSLPGTNQSSLSTTSYTVSSQRYMSNVQCSNSNTAQLWNGGCTFDTNYYNAVSGCSPYAPLVTCPSIFDFRLGAPVVSSDRSNGYQLVQLRRQGTANFDATMCLSSTASNMLNFARATCLEMFGPKADFYAGYTYSGNNQPKPLTNVRCNEYASLSQCTATTSQKTTYCSNTPYVQCKISAESAIPDDVVPIPAGTALSGR